ncbi:MAG: hypothetical protein AMS26_19530 [Bacteroides sp. SM23_62]|nr:MAG: hypothetical protein AMS26_19530 [Bacteroides sp. SM23_62]
MIIFLRIIKINSISLEVSFKGITDLTGIGVFINLENLSRQYNQITSLDISNNIHLGTVYLNDMPTLKRFTSGRCHILQMA